MKKLRKLNLVNIGSQNKFLHNLARLILYANEKGYYLTLGEGFLELPRFEKYLSGDLLKKVYRHKTIGFHPKRLAVDLNLFIFDGFKYVWLDKGTELEWKDLAKFWENLDPLNFSGINISDANHFSYGEGKLRSSKLRKVKNGAC